MSVESIGSGGNSVARNLSSVNSYNEVRSAESVSGKTAEASKDTEVSKSPKVSDGVALSQESKESEESGNKEQIEALYKELTQAEDKETKDVEKEEEQDPIGKDQKLQEEQAKLEEEIAKKQAEIEKNEQLQADLQEQIEQAASGGDTERAGALMGELQNAARDGQQLAKEMTDLTKQLGEIKDQRQQIAPQVQQQQQAQAAQQQQQQQAAQGGGNCAQGGGAAPAGGGSGGGGAAPAGGGNGNGGGGAAPAGGGSGASGAQGSGGAAPVSGGNANASDPKIGNADYNKVTPELEQYYAERGEEIQYDDHPVFGKIPLVERQGHRINANLGPSFDSMVEKAKADGVDLQINSGYRTYDEQMALWQPKLAEMGGNEAATIPWVAKPGTAASNHEQGMAIDFKNNGGQEWMRANGQQFGFSPYDLEPWHFNYTGGNP